MASSGRGKMKAKLGHLPPHPRSQHARAGRSRDASERPGGQLCVLPAGRVANTPGQGKINRARTKTGVTGAAKQIRSISSHLAPQTSSQSTHTRDLASSQSSSLRLPPGPVAASPAPVLKHLRHASFAHDLDGPRPFRACRVPLCRLRPPTPTLHHGLRRLFHRQLTRELAFELTAIVALSSFRLRRWHPLAAPVAGPLHQRFTAPGRHGAYAIWRR